VVGRGGGTADRVAASPVGVKPVRCFGTGAREPLDSPGFSTGLVTEKQHHRCKKTLKLKQKHAQHDKNIKTFLNIKLKNFNNYLK